MSDILKGILQSLILASLIIIIYSVFNTVISLVSKVFLKKKIRLKLKKFRFFLISFVALAIILVPLRLFFYETLRVYGNIMSPSLNNGDIILVRKTPDDYIYKHGQIVIYEDNFRSSYNLSRVIAESGDNISVVDGDIVINGLNLSQGYINNDLTKPLKYAVESNNGIEYTISYSQDQNKLSNLLLKNYVVPQGKVLLLTDQRSHYTHFNPNFLLVYSLIDKKKIIGYVETIFFNLSIRT